MTLSSRVPAVLDALVALFRAELDDDVTVTDGPLVTDDTLRNVVCVGWDGDDTGDGQAVEWAQQYQGLGAPVKDERIQVTCVAICWDGDDDMTATRTRLYVLFALIEAALRADKSLGFASPTVVSIVGGRLHQEATADGMQVRLPFVIDIETRI